jgi:hypothetical protein
MTAHGIPKRASRWGVTARARTTLDGLEHLAGGIIGAAPVPARLAAAGGRVAHQHRQARRRPARGSGLAGISRRIEAHDGTFMLASPSGGPTTLTVSLPCGL